MNGNADATTREKFVEAIHLLKAFLTEEYPSSQFLMIDQATYTHFLKEAREGRGKRPATPAPIVNTPPIPKAVPPKEVAPIVAKPVPPSAPKAMTMIAAPPAPKRENVGPKDHKNVLLEESPKHNTDALLDVKERLASLFPHLTILDTPPDDGHAKSIKESWKHRHPSVVIGATPEEPVAFLQTMAKGISERLALAEVCTERVVIERYLASSDVRLLIATPKAMEMLKGCDKPVIALREVDAYVSDAALKRSLWQHICQSYNSGTVS